MQTYTDGAVAPQFLPCQRVRIFRPLSCLLRLPNSFDVFPGLDAQIPTPYCWLLLSDGVRPGSLRVLGGDSFSSTVVRCGWECGSMRRSHFLSYADCWG